MRSYLLVPNGAPPSDPQWRFLVPNDASSSAGSLASRTVPSAHSTYLLPELVWRRVIQLLHRLMQRKNATSSNASQRPAGRFGIEDLLPR